jgi:Ca2+-binding RTX toxin-like protein
MLPISVTSDQARTWLQFENYRLGASQYTFSIPTASSSWSGYAADEEPFDAGYAVATAALAAGFRNALSLWDDLIAPDFTEVADSGGSHGELRVAFTGMDANTSGYAFLGEPTSPGGKTGDVWINSSFKSDAFASGSFGYEVLLHEIGHTLGMKHPFDAPVVPAEYDNIRYTVMAYAEIAERHISFGRNTNGSYFSSVKAVVATTPMVLDILAVQAIYGADTGTRTGADVYRFTQWDPSLRTIYDAGGNDTIDVSDFTLGNIIDLRAGAYSSIGRAGAEEQIAYWTAIYPAISSAIRQQITSRTDLYTFSDNLGIAVGTVIENAIGGSAADTITGNDAANRLEGRGGNDVLAGGAGDDLLIGGTGADRLDGGDGTDTASYRNAAAGVTVNLATGVHGGEALGDSFSSIERIELSGFDDLFVGSDADDFAFALGGNDDLRGGGGGDGFFFGGMMTAADRVDGGAGTLDQIGLQGHYPGLTFGVASLVGVEQLVLLPGSDTRFGDTSGAFYSYNLTAVDANVAAGQQLVVTANTLRAGENFTFNGAAELDGSLLTYGGLGIDILTGGQKDDGFFFGTGGRFGSADRLDGQSGSDQLGLQGAYTGANAVTFGADQLKSVEFIVALSGGDVRFGGNGAGYSYDLSMHDGNVAAGGTMIVSANTLRADETLTFDGSAEMDGRFLIFSGNGADVITGGAGADEIVGGGGDDRITGGLGGDKLNGGGGADRFVYAGAAESSGLGFDTLTGFDHRVDRIDLPGSVGGGIATVGTGSLSRASFDADLAAATNGALEPGSGVLFRAGAGDFSGRDFLVVDTDGDGSYTAGLDYVFEIVGAAAPIPSSGDFFI